jgi:hypothetical protein
MESSWAFVGDLWIGSRDERVLAILAHKPETLGRKSPALK